MFSYQHIFHAGNHADVLKHSVLSACLRHLLQKESAIGVVDMHAGTGVYDLKSIQAKTSQEAEEGIMRLQKQALDQMPLLSRHYLEGLQHYRQTHHQPNAYLGSPAWAAMMLRPQDQLTLFEVHPNDHRRLRAWVETEPSLAKVNMLREDGFTGMRRLLPIPKKRGLIICDPSYELKSDYDSVLGAVEHTLARFATAMVLVWIPLVARPQAHALPRKLKTLATKYKKPSLHALLQVCSGHAHGPSGGLAGSAVWLMNPPYTLSSQLKEALPYWVKVLGRDNAARFQLSEEMI